MRSAAVRCLVCERDVPAVSSRQAVVAWARSASRQGTMTSPVGITQLGIWVCAPCLRHLQAGGHVAELTEAALARYLADAAVRLGARQPQTALWDEEGPGR